MIIMSDPNQARCPTYVMPPAALGPCLWRHSHADTEAVPALITQIGTRSVLLTVFAPDNRGGMPMDGVRHASDPELREMPANDSGCWDYLPAYEANTALLYDAL